MWAAIQNPFFLHINADRPELLLYLDFTYANKKSGATGKRAVDEDNPASTICAVQGLYFGLDTDTQLPFHPWAFPLWGFGKFPKDLWQTQKNPL